jgi:uncharacterized repeat protein (TIGR01451 family)
MVDGIFVVMQMSRRMTPALEVIALMCLIGTFPGRAAAQNLVTPTVKPTPPGNFIIVNNSPGNSAGAHVSGDLVCYTTVSSTSVTIHYFNLATQTDAVVPQPASGSQDLQCDVRGPTIAFIRVGSPDSASPCGQRQDVLVFDVSTGGPPAEIAPLADSCRQETNIGDQTIAWQEAFGPLASDTIIVAYNRTDGSTQILTPPTVPAMTEGFPAVSPDGSVVVYERCPNASQSSCTVWSATRSNATWTAQQLPSQTQGNELYPDTDGTLVTYGSNYLTNGVAGDHLVWQPVGGGTEQVLNFAGHVLWPAVDSKIIAFAGLGPTDPGYQLAVYDVANNVLYNVQADLTAAGLFPQVQGTTSVSQVPDISVTPDGKVRVVWNTVYVSSTLISSSIYAYTFNIGADLAITKTGPQFAAPGSNITYNLTVTNNGPQDATSVVVTDNLAPGTTLVSCGSPLGTCGGTASAPTIAFGSLANGDSVGATLIVTAPPSPNGTMLSNTASVTAAGIDPNLNNNSSTASTTLTAIYNICLLYDPTHAVKSGATIPIKIALCDSNGNDVSSSSIVVTAVSLVQVSTSTTDTIEDAGNSNPDNNFRFDATLGVAGGYVFNLKTTGLGTGTYNLGFTAGSDPTVHTVSFQVK